MTKKSTFKVILENINCDFDEIFLPRNLKVTQDKQSLKYHLNEYFKNCKQLKHEYDDFPEREHLLEDLSLNQIEAVKLNYNIDPRLQRYTQYQCFIKLTDDFEYLVINNVKLKDEGIFIQTK